VCPDVYDLVIALPVGDDALLVLAINFTHLVSRVIHDAGLFLRNNHVIHSY